MIEITGPFGKSMIVESLTRTSKCLVISYDKNLQFADYRVDNNVGKTLSPINFLELVGNELYQYVIIYTNFSGSFFAQNAEFVDSIKLAEKNHVANLFVLVHK